MDEAHKSKYSVHPGETKMFCDLKRKFWWRNMRREIATYVSKCLICQQVKFEHRKPGGLLQPLEIPEWKWEGIAMDFVEGLPNTPTKKNQIWVVCDRLTKSAHFIATRKDYSVLDLSKIYVKEVLKYHGPPTLIVSDRGT